MIRTLAPALVLLLVAPLTGCSDDATDAAPAAERTAANGDVYNDGDVEFATAMIRHHADALVMVDLTQGRDLSPELAELTEAVRATQAPEIETMVDWLTAWGEEVPATSRDHVNSHAMGDDTDDGSDDGMGTDPDDLEMLEDAEGAAFETMWLELMIEHHEGAIEMAKAEQEAGTSTDALALAESVESGQRAQVDLMEDLLAG